MQKLSLVTVKIHPVSAFDSRALLPSLFASYSRDVFESAGALWNDLLAYIISVRIEENLSNAIVPRRFT
jgi:hypothetical protein